jgi:hypothetical protein
MKGSWYNAALQCEYTYLLRHIIRADVEGCAGFGSLALGLLVEVDEEVAEAIEGLDGVVSPDASVRLSLLFFFLVMSAKECVS